MSNFTHRIGFTSFIMLVSVVLAIPSSFEREAWMIKRGRQSPITRVHHGKGTTWGGNWHDGNCVFRSWDQPKQYHQIAMGGDNWDDGLYCGACIEVQSGRNKPVVGIVCDKCPSCDKESLDFDPPMWSAVTNGASPGIVDITWKVVPCHFKDLPMLLIKKEGMSKWWFAVQVAQSGQPIAGLKYRPTGTTAWQPTKRDTNSNFFMSGGGIPAGAAADIKVCCADGTEIITPNVDLNGPGVVHASKSCPPTI